MRSILKIVIAAWAAGIMPISGASSADDVLLSRAVFVERLADNGQREVSPARDLRKGDTVILYVEWQAARSGEPFIISSPVPRSLAFQRSSLHQQSVSIDGGKSWGVIGQLRVRNAYGARLASVEDVTHLRWRIPASKTRQRQGKIAYSAIVR